MNCQQNQRGFSLIELLMSMFLVSLAMAAAYSVYSASSKAATMQTLDSRMQDNARMAMDVIARNLRIAGFLIDFASYPKSATKDGSFDGLTSKLRFQNNAGLDGSDVIRIAGIPNRGSLSCMNRQSDKGAISLEVLPRVEFRENDIIGIGLADTARVLSTASSGTIINLDNMSGDTPTPAAAVNLDYPGVIPKDPASVIPPGQTPTGVVRLMVTTLGIVSDATDSHPVLEQNDFINTGNTSSGPVAEDIEDIQYAFGVDLNNNMIIDAAEWIFDRPLTDEEAAKIRLVRVTIVARTSQEDPSLRGQARWVPQNNQPIEDREPRQVTDGFRRYILTRTIGCRNMSTVNPL